MTTLLRASFIILLGNSVLLVAAFIHPPTHTIYTDLSSRCQEDEVFAWVANDVRGCVNYDNLLTTYTDDWEVK
mgnify:CR=1 FL=1